MKARCSQCVQRSKSPDAASGEGEGTERHGVDHLCAEVAEVRESSGTPRILPGCQAILSGMLVRYLSEGAFRAKGKKIGGRNRAPAIGPPST